MCVAFVYRLRFWCLIVHREVSLRKAPPPTSQSPCCFRKRYPFLSLERKPRRLLHTCASVFSSPTSTCLAFAWGLDYLFVILISHGECGLRGLFATGELRGPFNQPTYVAVSSLISSSSSVAQQQQQYEQPSAPDIWWELRNANK